MFKRMLAGAGIGGASVETVLTNPNCYPGGLLAGTCHLVGGKVEQVVDEIEIELVAKVEVEYETSEGDGEYNTMLEFFEQKITGRFEIHPGQRYDIPWQIPVPWETPITMVQGQPLKGMTLNVRTDVEIARARDAGDLDPIHVHPLPAQDRMLAALINLGFRFKSADLEKGRVPGSTLPFYQEIEFAPSPEFARMFNELELTFLANSNQMDVLFEVDKRGGFLSSGGDSTYRFTVPFGQESADWENQLRQHLHSMGQRRGWF